MEEVVVVTRFGTVALVAAVTVVAVTKTVGLSETDLCDVDD